MEFVTERITISEHSEAILGLNILHQQICHVSTLDYDQNEQGSVHDSGHHMTNVFPPSQRQLEGT